MKIFWNEVTWYSKAMTLVVFLLTVSLVSYLSFEYGKTKSIIDLNISASSTPATFLNEKTLSSKELIIGSWVRTLSESDTESFVFKQGKVSSYLHNRPSLYVDCLWNMVENSVVVSCSDFKDSFQILSLTQKILVITHGEAEDAELYYRSTE